MAKSSCRILDANIRNVTSCAYSGNRCSSSQSRSFDIRAVEYARSISIP